MQDKFGRTIDYMRVSITDRCNLRCRYCMPDGIEWMPMDEILTYEEIIKICTQATRLGIRKIKVTGGEPLVRKGCAEFIGMLKKIPEIEQVTLTTNGVLLADYAAVLKENGLDAVNVSLDTLDAGKFHEITGFDAFDQVLAGIEAAEKQGIPVKINSVLQYGKNENEWKNLVMLAKDKKRDVRFIEMMPIGYGKKFEPVYNEILLKKMKEEFRKIESDLTVHGNGPAIYYKIPGFAGSIGFISAIHGKFCNECNRIRMTATGKIKSCLCYDYTLSVKEAVRMDNIDEVREILKKAIEAKPGAHCFEELDTVTEQHQMVSIGG